MSTERTISLLQALAHRYGTCATCGHSAIDCFAERLEDMERADGYHEPGCELAACLEELRAYDGRCKHCGMLPREYHIIGCPSLPA